MNYVKHKKFNDIETKEVACIELNGKPNAATEGAVGLLGMDMTSPTHDVYKCVAVNGGVYTWELLSSGMSIMSAKITGGGASEYGFPYTALLTPSDYIIKKGDLIIDKDGYLYKIYGIGSIACTASYCGTRLGGMASGDKEYSLIVKNGKLQLVTESGAVISNIDYLVPDGKTIPRDTGTGEVSVRGIYTINNTLMRLFQGTQAEYDNLTDEQKENLFPIITDDPYAHESSITKIKNGSIVVAGAVRAYTADSLGTPTLTYKVDTTTMSSYICTGVTDSSTVADIVIPGTYRGYPVTGISDLAFRGRSEIRSVVISTGITSIGKQAFDGCTSLEDVFVSNSVTTIGSSAFLGCTSLKKVILPSSVETINARTFANCTSLVTVYIPATCSTAYATIFKGSDAVTIYTGHVSKPTGWVAAWNSSGRPVVWGVTSFDTLQAVSATNAEHATTADSATTAYALGTRTLQYEWDSTNSCYTCTGVEETSTVADIVIPGTYNGYPVTKIGERAFENRTEITSVVISPGVTSIDQIAFSRCSSLEKISIANSVTSIGMRAFSRCTSLKKVIIPSSVTKVLGYVFEDCTSLVSVYIPTSVTTASLYMFNNCPSVTIYVGHASQPSSWVEGWNSENCPVVWGVTSFDTLRAVSSETANSLASKEKTYTATNGKITIDIFAGQAAVISAKSANGTYETMIVHRGNSTRSASGCYCYRSLGGTTVNEVTFYNSSGTVYTPADNVYVREL